MKPTKRHNLEAMAIMIRRITDYVYMSSTELAERLGLDETGTHSFVKVYRLQLEKAGMIEPRSSLTLHQIRGYRMLMKYLEEHPGEHYVGDLMRQPSVTGGLRQYVSREIEIYRRAGLPFPFERIKYGRKPSARRAAQQASVDGLRWVTLKTCDADHRETWVGFHRQWHRFKREARHAA